MKRSFLPATRPGWWAFGLSLAAIFLGVLLPFFSQLLAPLLSSIGLRIPMGFSIILLEFILAISALLVGINAFGRGERSWLSMLLFGLTVIVGGFWILFTIGEMLVPH